jgi:cytidylate kinase
MKIAISGLSGCGNTTATRNVAEKLNYQAINYTFRSLADNLSMNFEDIHQKSTITPLFDYLVDLETLKLSNEDQVVAGSRLSAWLLNADLKVWLSASVEERSARIFSREPERYDQSYEKAFVRTLKRDQKDRKRYLEFYGLDINTQEGLDLILNTEQLTASQVSSLITAAANWAHSNHLKKTNSHRDRLIKIITSQVGPESEEYLKTPQAKIRELFDAIRHRFPELS